MSTTRGRGDYITTGNKLKLRDGSAADNEKPVAIQVGDNNQEVILKSPSDTAISSMSDGEGDDVGKKVDELVGVKAAQTFENKTFDLTENTLLGTLAEFDAALEDDDFAAINAEQTLYNKTLVVPKISDATETNTYNVTVEELTADRNINLPLLTADDEFTFNYHEQTLTTKSISALSNTIRDISDLEVINGAAINTTKLADGSVTNEEFQTLSDINTSETIQSQLDKKLDDVALAGDNQIPRFDTDGQALQHSGVTISDTDDVAGIVNLSLTGSIEAGEASPSSVDIGAGANTTNVNLGKPGAEVNVRGDLRIDGDFYVDGNTVAIDATTMEVEDANITVNKGGNQVAANTQKAGLTVEMSDATDAVLGFDSTSPTKWVLGESGTEEQVVGAVATQTLENKTVDFERTAVTSGSSIDVNGKVAVTTGITIITTVLSSGDTLKVIEPPAGFPIGGRVTIVNSTGTTLTVENNVTPGAGEFNIATGNGLIKFQPGLSLTLVCDASQSFVIEGMTSTGLTLENLTVADSPATGEVAKHYLVDTTGGPITITLPSGEDGAIVKFSDSGEDFSDNNLTIVPAAGEEIDGYGPDTPLVCDVDRAVVELLWDGAKWAVDANMASVIPVYWDASQVTSGVFDLATLPDLPASKTTSGTFDVARIPDLDASKITTGTLSSSVLPAATSTTPGAVVGLKQYVHGTDFTITAIDWTVTATFFVKRAVIVPYQTVDGAWRAKLNIVAASRNSTDTASVNQTSGKIVISGLTFKSTSQFYQNVSALGSPTAREAGRCYADPNTSNLVVGYATAYSFVSLSGDVELDSKPTWAD
jgi:hypothetical protein